MNEFQARLLQILRDFGPATASELAKRTLKNNGFCGYHLTQLWKNGWVSWEETRAKTWHNSIRTWRANREDEIDGFRASRSADRGGTHEPITAEDLAWMAHWRLPRAERRKRETA